MSNVQSGLLHGAWSVQLCWAGASTSSVAASFQADALENSAVSNLYHCLKALQIRGKQSLAVDHLEDQIDFDRRMTMDDDEEWLNRLNVED
ncbi:hypothetical protein BLNAU_9594 [Blattamonas nauphoetae]|uniref:Uncharacterized protein n=1 Tax=Blattamonas nauphoetae TaxID=2049346 RepID=A0ABQ9XVR3_9EUKA|nr:hypothetical protein BLNAU_25229 [Blattamonas nauphoetae]KAK2955546.1 hypothetical protein BLNAU_9594 [Blattamonas nauphoetae]